MPAGISVIAGNGNLPEKVLKNLKKYEIFADVIGIASECKTKISRLARRYVEIEFYDLDKGIEQLKIFGNKEVIFIGGLSKMNFIKLLRPSVMKKVLKLGGMSDEEILSGVIRRLEDEGFEVINFSRYYEEGIVKEGLICGNKPETQCLDDALYGMNFIKHNSDFSTGQSVILKDHIILAVETATGTDFMIRTAGEMKVRDAVFVKCSKRNQDYRVDLPSIGKRTIDLLIKVGIKNTFLESNKTIIIGDIDTIKYAEKKGITIWGLKSEQE